MNIRQQLVECLEFAESVEQLGDEVTRCQQQLVLMQNDENRCDDRTSLLRKIRIIATGLSLLLIAAGIVQSLEQGLESLILSVIMACPLIAVIAIIGFLWRRSSNKLRSLQEENQGKRLQIEAKIQQLQDRLRSLVEYGHEEGYFDIVPMDYFDSGMLEYCISVIDRKLATTLQEVFLLLEQELQRQEQMEHRQMLYEAQAEQMERLTNAVNVNTMATVLASQERKN